jgi:hypothetical protein
MWPKRFEAAMPSSDQIFDQPEGLRALFAGDALTRAMAAEALGGGGPIKIEPQWDVKTDGDVRAAIILDSISTLPYLIEACADDYPIVRFFALQGIASQEPRLGKPDYLTPTTREGTVDQLWQKLLALRPGLTPANREQVMNQAQELRKHKVNVDLDIGE